MYDGEKYVCDQCERRPSTYYIAFHYVHDPKYHPTKLLFQPFVTQRLSSETYYFTVYKKCIGNKSSGNDLCVECFERFKKEGVIVKDARQPTYSRGLFKRYLARVYNTINEHGYDTYVECDLCKFQYANDMDKLIDGDENAMKFAKSGIFCDSQVIKNKFGLFIQGGTGSAYDQDYYTVTPDMLEGTNICDFCLTNLIKDVPLERLDTHDPRRFAGCIRSSTFSCKTGLFK
jgi:hypothetical protein